jgi:hypothetical protein
MSAPGAGPSDNSLIDDDAASHKRREVIERESVN